MNWRVQSFLKELALAGKKPIVCRATLRITSTYQGTSKFDFWKKLQPEDIVKVEITMLNIGDYKSEVHLTNLTQNITFKCSQNQLTNYTHNFNYEQLS